MKDKKKKRNRVAVGIGITAVAIIGSVVAYKKCPKFKGVVDFGFSKFLSVFKKETPKTTIETPKFNTKPFRTYENYSGKKIK